MSMDGARIVWTEGLFLRPHHFQQQERFLEWLIHTRISQTVAFGHGFFQLSLDEPLRRQGKLALRSASGVLADGTPFQMPSMASPVAPLDIPEGTRNAVVHLHSLLQRPDAKAFVLDPGSASSQRARFSAVDVTVDDNTMVGSGQSRSEAVLKLGVLTLALALDSTLDGAATSLPVARVIDRGSSGEVNLDPLFIPPMLDAVAQPRLHDWLQDIHGLVRQRGDAVAARIGRQGSKAIADFLLLQLCNRYEPLLAQWLSGSPIHPYALHQELLKFAGECRTVDTKARRAVQFPAYKHLALAETFDPVIEEIRRTLVTPLSQTAVQLSLKEIGNGFFGADIPDPRMLSAGYLVLAIAANLPESRIRDEMPRQIRIGPVDKIEDLIISQLPGVQLEPLMGAPIEIQYHQDFVYFALERGSSHWAQIGVSRRLVLYVAGKPPGLEFELWSVRPQ